MKKVMILPMLFLVLASDVFGELTKEDLQEIKAIVSGELQHVEKRLDQRIDAVRERINAMEKRIDNLEKHVDQRIDTLEKHLDQRLGSIGNLMYVMLAGMFTLVGFVLWDRRTTLSPVQHRQMELEQRERRLENAIKEYAMQEPKLAEVLRSFGLL